MIFKELSYHWQPRFQLEPKKSLRYIWLFLKQLWHRGILRDRQFLIAWVSAIEEIVNMYFQNNYTTFSVDNYLIIILIKFLKKTLIHKICKLVFFLNVCVFWCSACFCAVLCVCFCTEHFVMLPLILTCLLSFTTFCLWTSLQLML